MLVIYVLYSGREGKTLKETKTIYYLYLINLTLNSLILELFIDKIHRYIFSSLNFVLSIG